MDHIQVLTIEDSRSMRHQIAHLLNSMGYQVIQAKDGIEGLRQFQKYQPDVVLCDLRMPGLDGLEVLAQLVAQAPETPVIIISGAGELKDAIIAFQRGAWDYLTKPIADSAVLQHAILRALDRARLLRENRTYRENLERLNHELKDSLQKLEADENAGRQMQFQLLPPEQSQLGDYQFNRYLLTSLYLSGDFVDYFIIDEHHLGFYLADVAGHGVPSALITILLKNFISQYLEEYRQGNHQLLLQPENLLERLNQDLLRSHMDKYLTMFYGVINSTQNTLIFSNGGQLPAPVLVDNNGHADLLGGKGFPIGLFQFARYEQHYQTLPTQFTLILFSDGILETLPQPTLAEKITALTTAACQAIPLTLNNLLATLQLHHHPAHLIDDVTLLFIQKNNTNNLYDQ